MKGISTVLGGTMLVIAGFAAGIYLQHRWPLGGLIASLRPGPAMASRSLADLSLLPPARRIVLVVAGQSNAANYGETRRAAGYRVFAFNRGELYTAVDPLPGGDGDGGSIWSRLGARLAMTDDFDAVIIAVVAQGSTHLQDWTPGGSCHERLVKTLKQLAAARLPADYCLWQQGETEAGSPAAAGPAYLRELQQLHQSCRQVFPNIVFVTAHATYGASPALNEQIQLAQAAAADLPGALPGPDLDTLGGAFRRDGIHFNDSGLSAAADLWFASLKGSLARRKHRLASP